LTDFDEYSCGTGETDTENNLYKTILQEYDNYKTKYLCLIEMYDLYYLENILENDSNEIPSTFLIRCICNENNCNSPQKARSIKIKIKTKFLH
jgi:hypothetical protein